VSEPVKTDSAKYLVELGAAMPAASRLPADTVLVPPSFTVHDLERFNPGPRRYSRRVRTSDIPTFVRLSKQDLSGVPGSACLVDADRMSAATYYNLGTIGEPGHGDHFNTLTLKKTAECIALQGVSGALKSQRDMAEWLEDWRDILSPEWPSTEGFTPSMQVAISAIRNTDVEAIQKVQSVETDFSSARSDLERIEAKGREVPLPSMFVTNCELYSGLPPLPARLRLSAHPHEKGVRFSLRLVRPDWIEEELARSFRSLLESELKDSGIRVEIGSFGSGLE